MEKPSQLRAIPVAELHRQLAQTREELAALRFKAKQGTVEQPHRIRQMKRHIARLLTVLNERKRVTV
jgi:large subunit ribosomal protein L29